ncbi:hypothetical protein [Nocardia sp. NPDC057440]|uniref:hypothetical protein n=1 Tax=Nocardia sp. NPDC057440 TaxID=3346134 RepID=UPI00366BE34E
MLLVIAALFAVGVGRLAIWVNHPRSRLLTTILLTLACSYALALPEVDHAVDHRTAPILSDNISDLTQTILLVCVCYGLGRISLRSVDGDRYIHPWTAAALTAIGAMLVAYSLSRLARTPVDDATTLTDSPTVTFFMIYLGYLALTCALIILGTIRGIRTQPGDLRWPLLAICVMAVLGAAYAINAAALLVFWPAIFHRSQGDIFQLWSGPALTLLAVAGLWGLVIALRHR